MPELPRLEHQTEASARQPGRKGPIKGEASRIRLKFYLRKTQSYSFAQRLIWKDAT